MSDLAWTEPGAHRVAEGVHRLPLPLPLDGLRAVNVYVLETDDGLVLVDGGWAIPAAREVLDASLREIGYAVGDVRRFLVTHMHRDHYTQAVAVRREVGSHVSLGIGERATLDLINAPSDVSRDASPDPARLVAAGAHELVEPWLRMTRDRPPLADYAYPDAWLEDDVALDVGGRTLEVVATPGHTQGHVVFVDRAAGLLFAGDHVLPSITPSIGFEPAWVRQPLRDFLGSLRKVRALPDLRLLPAHGPVTSSSHVRIDELLGFHDARLAASRDAVRAGAATAWSVAQELPWTRRQRRAGDLSPFDAVLAAFETLAHLELLALRGDLTRRERDGVVEFGPADRDGVELRPARVDDPEGERLIGEMRAEIASLYADEAVVLDGPGMPKAGPDELGPPYGTFLVGWSGGRAVCCGGLKRLSDGACEIKRMYVVPEARGRGIARRMLHALEDEARRLGYAVARLDTSDRQPHAIALYRSEGYVEIGNFNANPVATYFAERVL